MEIWEHCPPRYLGGYFLNGLLARLFRLVARLGSSSRNRPANGVEVMA